MGGTRAGAMSDYFRGEIAGQLVCLSADSTEFFGKVVQPFDSSIVIFLQQATLGQLSGGVLRQLRHYP